MTDQILTDEQYHELMEGSLYFQEYIGNGACRSIQPRFLSTLQRVYSDFYHSPLNINCGQCVGTALTKLWHHMEVKKGSLEEAAARLKEQEIKKEEIIKNEKEGRNKPGRPSKS